MKISILKSITITLAMLAGLTVSAQNAVDIMKKAAANIASAPSVTVNFTMSQPGGASTSGKMIISGKNFFIDTPLMATWFDGRTQWTLSKENKEVTVSEPTVEELSQSNPLVILNEFQNHYSASILKSQTASKVIKLNSKATSSPISSVVVTLNSSSLSPVSLVLTMSNRQTLSVKVTSFQRGKKLSAKTFTYDAKKYPANEIIDLR